MKSEQEISKKISVKLNILHLMETSLVKLLDRRKKNEIKKNISSLGKRLDDLLKLKDFAQVWYLKNKSKIGKGK